MLKGDVEQGKIGVPRIWLSIAAGYVLFLFGTAVIFGVMPDDLVSVVRLAMYITLPPYILFAFATVVVVLKYRLRIGPFHALAIGAVEGLLIMALLSAWSAPSVEALLASLAKPSVWLIVTLAGLTSLFVAGAGGLLSRR